MRVIDPQVRWMERGAGGLASQPIIQASSGISLRRWGSALLSVLLLACGSSGGDVADTGGMSGTGISQGSISSFGSIFVNGVEWDLTGTAIEIDDAPASEADLRLGMVVRIEGIFDANGATGTARSVVFDDVLEGPIEDEPTETTPGGPEKSFDVLGTTVFVHETGTIFAGGASFAGLAADDVVEVSGFRDAAGAIRATRVELEGTFPGDAEVELRGTVSNLTSPDPGGDGAFDLGSILIHYTAGTTFSGVTPADLSNGDFVEVEGTLRITGDEIDAEEVELETEGLGDEYAEKVEIEGFVTDYVSDSSFRVAGTPIDASDASFEPTSLVLANGSRVEVEGHLQGGVISADHVEDEEDEEAEDVRIEAAVSSVDPVGRELTILGVTVTADAETRIEDQRDGDENFRFDEIVGGDWLEIRGLWTGDSTALALLIERDEEEDDVRLEGPVTALDELAPALSILGQEVPLDAGTLYFDDLDQMLTEEEFFRGAAPVEIGDIVRATDESAVDPELLQEADEVELQDD